MKFNSLFFNLTLTLKEEKLHAGVVTRSTVNINVVHAIITSKHNLVNIYQGDTCVTVVFKVPYPKGIGPYY